MTTAEGLLDSQLQRFIRAFANTGIAPEVVWAAFHRARGERGFATADDLLAAGPGPIGDVWSDAYRTLPPFSALFAGASVPVGVYAIVDYLAASCATMADGMARLARYFKLVRPGVTIALSVTDSAARVDFVDTLREDWFFDEWTCGVTIQRFRVSTGRQFPAVEARFRRCAAHDLDFHKLTGFLGCTPELGVRVGGFSVDLDAWNAPLVMQDERMRESLEAHAERLLRENEQGQGELRRRIRDLVTRELRGGDASVQVTAKALGMTPRTLQRRLGEGGTSYQAVVDEIRAALADRYLEREGLSVTEVAFLLGYSEASAFARAYRRWTGRSPTARASTPTAPRSRASLSRRPT